MRKWGFLGYLVWGVLIFPSFSFAVSFSGGGGGSSSLTMVEQDASPSVSGVTSITVPNGSLTDNGSGSVTFTPSGTGDVVGPASSTDNAIVRFDLATGKLVQTSSVLISDTWDITGANSIAFGADPGDAGPIRLSNNTCLNWEIATPGTDKCLKVNASDQLDFNGTINLSGPTTGSIQLNGSTSGSLKWTVADAAGQAITGTVAAQTVGAATLTIPDRAGVNGTFAFTDNLDTSAELRAVVTDESGTGALLFAGGDIAAGTATTPSANDNDTSIATTAYV